MSSRLIHSIPSTAALPLGDNPLETGSRARIQRRHPHGLAGVALLIGHMAFAAAYGSDFHLGEHEPFSPHSQDSVLVTTQCVGPPYPSALWLHYQTVDPGDYIAFEDERFRNAWRSVPMSDAGLHGDRSPADGVYSYRLPSKLQKNRRFVRYFITESPAPADTITQIDEHQAYFVYDGVPDWSGAVNPSSRRSRDSRPVTFPSEALTRVPVYHLISKKEWIEAATWRPQRRSFRRSGENEYQFTGTFVSEGRVYDHVAFRARGGVWRHAMGKNMWKINFRRSNQLQAIDNYRAPYPRRWDKLNLGACIQQGQYGFRGEHGMFDALSYRLFNLAGTPSPKTHWVHFRIIDAETAATQNQYDGDFWGLYLAVENVDKTFIESHGLSAGNLYKIENLRPHLRYAGTPYTKPPSDAYQFLQGLQQRPSKTWWETHTDLPKYYRYRAVLESVHHYDISQGKNYYYYYDGGSARWFAIPWDVDLTWGERMFGSGQEPFYRAGALRPKDHLRAYQHVLAEFRDLLFNDDELFRLLEDHAAVIDPPIDRHSLADADRAMWDYHPVMRSPYVMGHQAGQGQYYFRQASGQFPVMVDYMKQFATERADWIDRNLLRGFRPLPKPELTLKIAEDGWDVSIDVPKNSLRYQWRLAPIVEQDFLKGRRPRYEIEARVLSAENRSRLRIATKQLSAGLHRVRARSIDKKGNQSRWSAPVELRKQIP